MFSISFFYCHMLINANYKSFNYNAVCHMLFCFYLLCLKEGDSNKVVYPRIHNLHFTNTHYVIFLASVKGCCDRIHNYPCNQCLSLLKFWVRTTFMVYSIQHYVIKFISDLRDVGGFLRVFCFPPPIKLTFTI